MHNRTMTATLRRPNGPAPTTAPGAMPGHTFRLGARGGKVAQAWQLIWNQLDHTEYRDVRPMAEKIARELEIKPISVIALVNRMVSEGWLAADYRKVTREVTRTATFKGGEKRLSTFEATHNVAFYRIARVAE
jgi:hypothetical protein